MQPELIRIATASDAKLWPVVPTMLASVLRRASLPVEAHLLTRGIDAEERRRLERECRGPSLSLHCHACDGREYDAKLLAWTAVSTMDRIALPEIVAGDGRIIYLDVDIAVFADLAELMGHATGSRGIAAKASISTGFQTLGKAWASFANEEPLPAGSVDPDWRSFNAGVLVLDLGQLRELEFSAQCRRIVEAYHANDQLALALFARGEFVRLDPSWNVFVQQDEGSVKDWQILHWIGHHKPWAMGVRLHEEWWGELASWNELAAMAGKPVAAKLGPIP
jgi:lipopolysaccharide biosynthesis glycosyltransferase